MSMLQHFDIRFNKIKTKLPRSILGMRNLTRLNIRGNGLGEINMAELLYLEFLNCSDNALRLLYLNEGPLNNLIARNNSELVIMSLFRCMHGFSVMNYVVFPSEEPHYIFDRKSRSFS